MTDRSASPRPHPPLAGGIGGRSCPPLPSRRRPDGARRRLRCAAGHLPGTERRTTACALDSELLLFAASLPLWVVLARAMGLYDRDAERPEHTTVDDLVGIVALVTTVVWLSFVVAYVTGRASPDFGKWVVFWALAIAGDRSREIGCADDRRAPCRRSSSARSSSAPTAPRSSWDASSLQHPEYRISLVGFVDASPRRLRDEVADVPVVGGAEELAGTRRAARDRSRRVRVLGRDRTPDAACSCGTCRRSACRWTSCPGWSRRSVRAQA